MLKDSFFNALKHFISRRGKIRELRQDGGKNVTEGKNELSAALKEVNTDSVKNFLLSQDRDQNERANYNSHMDGIQE